MHPAKKRVIGGADAPALDRPIGGLPVGSDDRDVLGGVKKEELLNRRRDSSGDGRLGQYRPAFSSRSVVNLCRSGLK